MKAYAIILKLIRDVNITGEDLVKGKIKLIYEKFIFTQVKNRPYTNYSRLHLKMFPNYLKTFNYKLSVDILPCKIKFVDFALDTDSKCNFCKINADSLYHIFAHCTALKFLWETLDRVLLLMGFQFRFVKAKNYGILDLRQSRILKKRS